MKARNSAGSLGVAGGIGVIVGMLICLAAVGCSETQQEAAARKLAIKNSLALTGELMGEIPDGRKVYRWKIPYDGHYVYVVGDDVTINRTERQGKVTRHRVEVMIGGVMYVPVEKATDE